MEARLILGLFAVGCRATAEPEQLPAGSVVAARVGLSDRPTEEGPNEIHLGVGFEPSTTGAPLVWDECGQPAGAAGGALSPERDVGEPWVQIDGQPLPLSSSSGSYWSVDGPVDAVAGAWLGAGWSGGADLEAFAVEEGLEIPEALELRRPLDADLDLGRDVVIRWRGSSPGFVGWALYDEERLRVSCNALDDGRFVIPAAATADLSGPGSLQATRVVREHHELESGAFVEFAVYRTVSWPVTFVR